MFDNLSLTSELEQRVLSIASGTSKPLPIDFCEDTKALTGATFAEVSDYFRERRDYLESVATLDLVVSVERALREDLELRRQNLKSVNSAIGQAVISTPNAPGQSHPAARRLLNAWLSNLASNTHFWMTIDQGMEYRNWVVHGGIGSPPYSLNPFTLDQAIEHVINFIQLEA